MVRARYFDRSHANRGISRKAFSLVELLAMFSAITVVVSLIIPAVSKMKDAAVTAKCISNWRGYSQALQGYVQDHEGRLPFCEFKSNPTTSLESEHQEVRLQLAPYLFGDENKWQKTGLFNCPGKWSYGFNAFTSAQPLSRYKQPTKTIYGIDLCNGGRWLDANVLSWKTGDLREATPKPHAKKVSVLWLDGHITVQMVSELMREDVTRDSSGEETLSRTPIGNRRFDQ